MTLLLGALGILLFIIALVLTVGLHELGHLIPAKKFGVKVPKYFIGFGPTVWSTHRGGTEWGIKALPLGGFVVLAGMLAPAPAGVRTTNDDGTPTLAQQARLDSEAQLEPGEEHLAFWRLPARKKIVVMFGGPFVNLLICAVLLTIVMTGIGLGTYSTKVAAISPCLTDVTISSSQSDGAGSSGECAAADASPAALAGFAVGDVITEWNGAPVTTWQEVQDAIAQGGTGTVDVEIERAGETRTLAVTPQLVTRETIVNGQSTMEEKPFVGISPAIELQRRSITEVPQMLGTIALGTVKIVAALPVKLWETAVGLVTGQPRSADSVVGIVGVADMASTITSSSAATYTLAQRSGDFLMLIASLNMSLFVFNLIPLLPLDGGHILGALIEGVRRQIAKMRGKPDPGAFDTARLLPLSYVVIAFFLAMTLLLVVADVMNPVF